MKIGVDLRSLQVGHQYRGIGEVVRRTLNEMFVLSLDDKEVQFVFFAYDDDDPKRLLQLPVGLNYSEVSLGKSPLVDKNRSAGQKFIAKWRLLFGNPVPQVHGCDVFLQYDHALGVPRKPRSIVVMHDLIPLVFWRDYFDSAWAYFKRHAARTTLRTLLRNYEYKRLIRRALSNASCVVCVSDYTKQDIRRFFDVPEPKLKTVRLGVSLKPLDNHESRIDTVRPTKPYLLFVGGIDRRRRRIDDLVAAYNNLKAQGHDIQLVLVGENFRSPEKIPVKIVRRAVVESSYAEDILTLGHVDDETKQALFKKAIAFVFPTVYEGFGIMTLEAMLHECPVIAYNNSSIPEVGGNHVLYANDWTGIWHLSSDLIEMPKEKRQKFIADAKKHAESFTWDKTANAIYRELVAR